MPETVLAAAVKEEVVNVLPYVVAAEVPVRLVATFVLQ